MTDERRVHEMAGWCAASLNHLLEVKDGKASPRGFKRCSTCRRLKTLESFYRFHRSRDGRLGRCKSCFLSKRGGASRERAGGLSGKIGSPVRTEAELLEALKRPEVFHT